MKQSSNKEICAEAVIITIVIIIAFIVKSNFVGYSYHTTCDFMQYEATSVLVAIGDYYSEPDHDFVKLPAINDLDYKPHRGFEIKLFGDINEEVFIIISDPENKCSEGTYVYIFSDKNENGYIWLPKE